MKNNLMKKAIAGFTLIEMLVVIAIISILAAVVLTGVSGFQASARDTKRIADLNQVRIYLEQYFSKNGHYPGTLAGVIGTPSAWSDLVTALGTGIVVPNDPLNPNLATRTYFYSVESTENLGYVIGAKLEKENAVLKRPGEIDEAGAYIFPTGYTPSNGALCADASFGYCIGSQ